LGSSLYSIGCRVWLKRWLSKWPLWSSNIGLNRWHVAQIWGPNAGGLRPVTPHLHVRSTRRDPNQRANDSILLGAYKYILASPRLTLLALWHIWHPCGPKKHLPLISILDSSSKWNWEWFLVHLLEWLHLVALEDRCGCGVLVTLGGCHHLDGLEQRWRSGTCWWLFVASSGDCEGSCTFPDGKPKGNSSRLLVSLSYLTCG
jgi:hypothetical protein